MHNPPKFAARAALRIVGKVSAKNGRIDGKVCPPKLIPPLAGSLKRRV